MAGIRRSTQRDTSERRGPSLKRTRRNLLVTGPHTAETRGMTTSGRQSVRDDRAARKRRRTTSGAREHSAIAGTGRPARFNDGQRRRPLPWSCAGRKYGSEQAAYLPRVCIPAGQCSAIRAGRGFLAECAAGGSPAPFSGRQRRADRTRDTLPEASVFVGRADYGNRRTPG